MPIDKRIPRARTTSGAMKPKTNKRPVTVRMPEGLLKALSQKVIDDGYGFKGKSRWVAEALTQFFDEPSWRDQTLDMEMIMGNDAKDVIYIDTEDRRALDRGVVEVERYAVEMNEQGHRTEVIDNLDITASAVVRAAIAARVFSLHMPKFERNEALFGVTPKSR